jgi:hypothetical protein
MPGRAIHLFTHAPTQLAPVHERHQPGADDDVPPVGPEQLPGFQVILGYQARLAPVFVGTLEHQARYGNVSGDQHVHGSFPPPASACR